MHYKLKESLGYIGKGFLQGALTGTLATGIMETGYSLGIHPTGATPADPGKGGMFLGALWSVFIGSTPQRAQKYVDLQREEHLNTPSWKSPSTTNPESNNPLSSHKKLYRTAAVVGAVSSSVALGYLPAPVKIALGATVGAWLGYKHLKQSRIAKDTPEAGMVS